MSEHGAGGGAGGLTAVVIVMVTAQIIGGGTWHAVSHRSWDKLMFKALGVLFGLCVLLMLLLIYVATDIDSQAHFDRLVEHFSE